MEMVNLNSDIIIICLSVVVDIILTESRDILVEVIHDAHHVFMPSFILQQYTQGDLNVR